MKLLTYIKNFVQGKLLRKDIRDRIRTIIQKYDEVVLPALAEIRASELANPTQGYRSAYAKQFHEGFIKSLPSNMRARMRYPYFALLERSLTNAVELLRKLDALVDKDLPDTLYIDGVTYQKASILRLIELLDFVAEYGSRQFNYLALAESNPDDPDPSTKNETAYIRTYQNTFLRAVELFYQPVSSILDAIGKLPEVLVLGSDGAPIQNVDVMTMGNIPVITPLWRFAGERLVDWDYARWERMRKEAKDTSARIELLRQRNSGQVDPRLESIIEGYNRELVLLRTKIERIESKVR